MFMRCSAAVVLAALFASLPFRARAAEVAVQADGVRVRTDSAVAEGDFASGRVAVKAAGVELAGRGQLLVARSGGVVSDLLAGGADRWLGDADTLVVRFDAADGAALLVLVNPSGNPCSAVLPPRALGVSGDAFAAYDYGRDAFAGPIAQRLQRPLAPREVALVALAPAGARPRVLATSTAPAAPGALDAAWSDGPAALSGTAPVEAGQPLELRILAPPTPVRWVAQSAAVDGGQATVAQTGAWVRVRLTCPAAGPAAWRVAFARETAAAPAAAEEPPAFTAAAPAPRCVMLTSGRHGPDMFVRRQDGAELPLDGPSLTDSDVLPERDYAYELCLLDWSGRPRTVARAAVKTPARPPLPPEPAVHLSDLQPVRAANGWNGDPRRDRSIQDNMLIIRRETYPRGMGVHAPAELVYANKPEYKRFVALVGLDDEAPSGSVVFAVFADATPLARTPVLTSEDDPFGLDVAIPAGAREIRLVVEDGGNGIGEDHADWARAGFVTAP